MDKLMVKNSNIEIYYIKTDYDHDFVTDIIKCFYSLVNACSEWSLKCWFYKISAKIVTN